MNVIETAIKEVKIIEPTVYEDERGIFFERYNKRQFDEAIGEKINFVQDNHSVSNRGVLRGFHYQVPPFGQGKLIRVLAGEIFDVAVDLRRSSPTFGKWISTKISANNKLQIWIPEGFAHGFLTISKSAELLYKTTSHYDPKSEQSILWCEPEIGINWPLENIEPILSKKDANAQSFSSVTQVS